MKKYIVFALFIAFLSSCQKKDIRLAEDNPKTQTSALQRNSSSNYFVADFVSPDNVGLHHTSCVKYVLDNLSKISSNPSEINEQILNGKVNDLINEYCEINGLTFSGYPNITMPETYTDLIAQNTFSRAMNELLTSSFEVFDNYQTSDEMFSALDANLTTANTLENDDEKAITKLAINVLKSSLDVWIVNNYNSKLPDNFNLQGRLSTNDVKVLRKDAIATVTGTLLGGCNPLSFCTGMITGTGASIATWMGQHGYDDSWWPF
jgi:hypothetical protein